MNIVYLCSIVCVRKLTQLRTHSCYGLVRSAFIDSKRTVFNEAKRKLFSKPRNYYLCIYACIMHLYTSVITARFTSDACMRQCPSFACMRLSCIWLTSKIRITQLRIHSRYGLLRFAFIDTKRKVFNKLYGLCNQPLLVYICMHVCLYVCIRGVCVNVLVDDQSKIQLPAIFFNKLGSALSEYAATATPIRSTNIILSLVIKLVGIT